jgi:hypothetical protein
MRLQLTSAVTVAGALAVWAGASGAARADEADSATVTTTWYQEQRQGGLGGLTVIHPQAGVSTGGEHVKVDLGYSADVVSGATATVYSVDAVSSATTFSDVRHEGTVGLSLGNDHSRLGLSSTVGVERDYTSLAIGGSASTELPGRNTALVLSYAHSFDAVCDKDNAMATPLERRALTGADACAKQRGIFGKDTPGTTVWQDLSIDTAQATLTQNLSPTMNLQLSTFGQLLDGMQSNPYRRVLVGSVSPQEYIPSVRARAALTVRLNKYLEPLRAAAYVSARGYSDTWGVSAGTLEVAWSQYAGDSLLLRFHGRLHQQSAATFFKDAFFYETESTAGAYFTGDRELSPVRNAVLGASLSILSSADLDDDGNLKKVLGAFDRFDVTLKGDAYLLSETPADDINANLAGTGGQFLTSGQLLDAVALAVSANATF